MKSPQVFDPTPATNALRDSLRDSLQRFVIACLCILALSLALWIAAYHALSLSEFHNDMEAAEVAAKEGK